MTGPPVDGTVPVGRRPDAVLRPRRARSLSPLVREAFAAGPKLVRLAWRLLGDPRVPTRSKVLLALALGYVASPVDLVPALLPVGLVDDVLVVALALNRMLESVGEDVVREHWDGRGDVLDVVRTLLDLASDLVPHRLRRLIRRLG